MTENNNADPKKENIGRKRVLIAGIVVAIAAAVIVTVVLMSGQLLKTATTGSP